MNSHIDGIIEAFVRRSAVPQLNVGIWHNDAFYEASFGSDHRAEVDVFETGSVGKTFTATLLAVLAENNVVNLDDKVDKFRPDLTFAKDITLLQLATHTAGLPNNPFTGIILNGEKALRNFSHIDYSGFLERIRKPLKTGRVKYSNLGMALLGNILADHLSMSYENAVKKHILTPLGMADTHVSPTAYDVNRVAIGHSGNGKAAPHFLWSCMEPAGIWRSTTKDMTAFLKAHLGYSGEFWGNLLAKTTSPAFDDSKREHQGLAWQLSHNKEFGDFAWHNGQTLGQKSMAICAKASGSAIVILSNKTPKIWQHFFSSYSMEKLSFDILESLEKSK
jgi:D-alanyl-D-alanine-carboxypeptidase/D-alanyl-D-alanine-endopeptidase